jgi:hypothetical protein
MINLAAETAIIAMTRALRDADLGCAWSRALAFIVADIDPIDIANHESEAIRRETLRRELFSDELRAAA